MPDTGRWSSDQPGELVTMPTEGEVTEFIAAEQAEAEERAQLLARSLFKRFRTGEGEALWIDQPAVFRDSWLDTAREILEEIE